MILYMYLAFTILVSITGFILLLFQIINNFFNYKEVLFGLVLSFFLYGLTSSFFYLFEEVYIFSSYFVFPFCMIILPFFIGVLFLLIKPKVNLQLVFFYCVCFSSIFILFYPKNTIQFVSTQNLNKTF